MSNKTGSNWVL